MANLYLDISLSDIPKELIKTAANGKKYLKAIIRPRREVDRDGYDHYIAAWVPKEQRNDADQPRFIGRAQLKEDTPPAREHPYSDRYTRNDRAERQARADGSGGTEDLPF